MKRYGLPLIVVIVSSFLLYLIRTYIFFSFKEIILTVLTAIALFILGVYMSKHSSRNKGWVKKVFVILLMTVLVLMQLGVFKVTLISIILSKIGATSVIFYMLYVYFGFIFF